MDLNLACGVYRHSLGTPDALAVAAGDRSLTYGQLAAAAMRLADALKRSPAWRRPDGSIPRVGILASRSVEACIAVVGAAWAGATYVPIGLKQPEDRIRNLLSLCDLSAIVADEQGAKRLSRVVLEACPPLVLVADAVGLRAPQDRDVAIVATGSLAAADIGAPTPVAPQDSAYILFTSGTTGVPKGVVIPARAVRHSVGSIGTWLGLRASDRLLEACELTFDPSVHNMFATWEVGASVHVLPTSRTLDAVKFARQAGLTVWSSVPSLVALLGQVKALGPGVLPGLRLSLFGGEQLPAAVVTAWRAAAPNSGIFNLYGPTEATVACTGIRLGLPSPITPGRDYMSIGRPLPGCRVAVVDASWRPVEDGEPGELAIAGVQLSDGYVNRPDLTADRFVTIDNDRWYLTGDRAMRDADGNLHWLGRLDNQVKILGHRVELEEVDAHLRAVADVDLVGTVAWPLTEGGSATGSVAFVGAESIDAERIQAGLRARLPAYMVPSRIVPLEAIPLNANGKVDRGALRRLLHAERA